MIDAGDSEHAEEIDASRAECIRHATWISSAEMDQRKTPHAQGLLSEGRSVIQIT